MRQSIQEWTKIILWRIAFKKFEGLCFTLGRPYRFKFAKGCLPGILIGQLFNTLSNIN